MAVEWAIHGVQPYTSEHAQYFQDEEVVMPTNVVIDPDANVTQTDVAFLHFLLNYFHRALQPLLRKVRIESIDYSYASSDMHTCMYLMLHIHVHVHACYTCHVTIVECERIMLYILYV
jgi:hypothetical protein